MGNKMRERQDIPSEQITDYLERYHADLLDTQDTRMIEEYLRTSQEWREQNIQILSKHIISDNSLWSHKREIHQEALKREALAFEKDLLDYYQFEQISEFDTSDIRAEHFARCQNKAKLQKLLEPYICFAEQIIDRVASKVEAVENYCRLWIETQCDENNDISGVFAHGTPSEQMVLYSDNEECWQSGDAVSLYSGEHPNIWAELLDEQIDIEAGYNLRLQLDMADNEELLIVHDMGDEVVSHRLDIETIRDEWSLHRKDNGLMELEWAIPIEAAGEQTLWLLIDSRSSNALNALHHTLNADYTSLAPKHAVSPTRKGRQIYLCIKQPQNVN
jgi:hypothetical protein